MDFTRLSVHGDHRGICWLVESRGANFDFFFRNAGRVAVAQAALMFRKKLFEMTQDYAAKKMCWSPKGSQPLIKVPQVIRGHPWHFPTFRWPLPARSVSICAMAISHPDQLSDFSVQDL